MRIVSTNRWEFDLPNEAVLTVTEHGAAEWLDGLIKDNKRLRAELAAVKADLNSAGMQIKHDEECILELQAELAACKEDAMRYRWLRDECLAMDSVADPDNMVCVWHGTDPAMKSCGRTLDAAIDAARREGE